VIHSLHASLFLLLTLVSAGALTGPSNAHATSTGPAVGEQTVWRQAIALLEAGKTEEAEAILGPAVESAPESPRLQGLLGTAQFLNRRYLVAADSLGRAAELGQRDLRTLYFLASVLWENGQMDRAEEICLEAIALHGSQVPLTHLLGRLLLWQGRYQEAVGWLQQAVTRSANSVDLWLDFTGALEGAGRPQEALAALTKAIELAPNHYQVRYGLARLLNKAGDREGAERELANYRRLLEEDQTRTLREGRLRAQIDLAYDLARQGRADEAIAQLEELPPGVEVQVARAEVARSLGDRDAMLQALEQAVALDPSRADLRARLAAARLAEGGGE